MPFVVIGQNKKDVQNYTSKTREQSFSQMAAGELNLNDSSDMAQTIKELNDDSISEGSIFSKIDLKTRLSNSEIASIIRVDFLVKVGFLPEEAEFITQLKKRLNVSEMGKGRAEIVAISQGMREDVGQRSFIDRFSGLFKKGE